MMKKILFLVCLLCWTAYGQSPSVMRAWSSKNHGTSTCRTSTTDFQNVEFGNENLTMIERRIDVGAGEIECRSRQLGTSEDNELKVVLQFNRPVILTGNLSDVVTDVGVVSRIWMNLSSDHHVYVEITGLPFHTQVNLSFPGILQKADGVTPSQSTLCIRVIVGDYDNGGRTNYVDFGLVESAGYLNQQVENVDTARADFDCTGRINYLDFSKVVAKGLINQTADACPSPPFSG